MGKTLKVSFPQPSLMFSRPWELTELQKCHSSVAYSRKKYKNKNPLVFLKLNISLKLNEIFLRTLGSTKFWDHSGVWPKVWLVFEDFNFKIQKARTKIEVFLSLPCWLSQLNWDRQQGTDRKTSILLVAFWNFKLKVLKYPGNCRLYATLILKV